MGVRGEEQEICCEHMLMHSKIAIVKREVDSQRRALTAVVRTTRKAALRKSRKVYWAALKPAISVMTGHLARFIWNNRSQDEAHDKAGHRADKMPEDCIGGLQRNSAISN